MKKEFSELFSESLKEYSSKFIPFLKLFLFLYFIPFVIIVLLIAILLISFLGISSLSGMAITNSTNLSQLDAFEIVKDALTNSTMIALGVLILLILFIFGILSFLMYLGFFYIAFSKNNEITFTKAIKGGIKYFWRFIGLGIIMSIALSLLFLLLIIPGIIFMVFWIFAPFILFGENKGVFSSLNQSFYLVKGRWWNVFGYLLLVGLICFVVAVIFSLLPLGGLFTSLVIYPFLIIFFKNFYIDLKKNPFSKQSLKKPKKIQSKRKTRKK